MYIKVTQALEPEIEGDRPPSPHRNKALKGQCFLEALPSTSCPVDMMKYSQCTGLYSSRTLVRLRVCDLTFIDYSARVGKVRPTKSLTWSGPAKANYRCRLSRCLKRIYCVETCNKVYIAALCIACGRCTLIHMPSAIRFRWQGEDWTRTK